METVDLAELRKQWDAAIALETDINDREGHVEAAEMVTDWFGPMPHSLNVHRALCDRITHNFTRNPRVWRMNAPHLPWTDDAHQQFVDKHSDRPSMHAFHADRKAFLMNGSRKVLPEEDTDHRPYYIWHTPRAIYTPVTTEDLKTGDWPGEDLHPHVFEYIKSPTGVVIHNTIKAAADGDTRALHVFYDLYALFLVRGTIDDADVANEHTLDYMETEDKQPPKTWVQDLDSD